MTKLNVNDTIQIPFPNNEFYTGIIIDIDENVDPRIKYTVEIKELKVIIFYSETMIRNITNEQ